MQEQLSPQDMREVSENESVQSPALDSTKEEQNCEVLPTSEASQEECEEPTINYSEYTEGQLVEAAKELMKNVPDSYASIKGRMDAIKHAFYKNVKAKTDEALKKFLEEGGKREDFVVSANPLEEELRELMNRFKEKRTAEIQRNDAEKLQNLAEKKRILEEMKSIIDSEEDFSAKTQKFKKLQQEWKEVGLVPASEVNSIFKTYQLYNESFYDNVKINNELRDYDFRKNLELKVSLCEQAEKLAELKDVVAAFRRLQELHDEWREIGPVAREKREEIWTRFKDASTVVNKKHHDYFDQLRASEVENLRKKTALCEQLESVDLTTFSTYKEWQEQTEKILKLQEEWKQIGFAPKKDNTTIFERFRTSCDNFFKAKNVFFKNTKEQLVVNLNKKIALCEKAESLKDSTDWKKTSDELVQLQKEWKTIGAVPKKQSELVWKRFVEACDTFFNRKNEELSGARKEQEENLNKKKEIVEKIKSLDVSDGSEQSYADLKALIAEWNAVGHVPFKEKDKIYKKYKEAIDKQFDKLNLDKASRRVEAVKESAKSLSPKEQQKVLFDERRKLMKRYEALNSEIATYENNISFFASSKKADSLVKDYENKIVKLKGVRDNLLAQIKNLDAASNNKA